MENQYLINLPNGMTVLATTHVVITWIPSDKTSRSKLARLRSSHIKNLILWRQVVAAWSLFRLPNWQWSTLPRLSRSRYSAVFRQSHDWGSRVSITRKSPFRLFNWSHDVIHPVPVEGDITDCSLSFFKKTQAPPTRCVRFGWHSNNV